MPRSRTPTLASSFSGLKSDYAAMTETRFRRRRTGASPMGGAGDYHYNSEAAFVHGSRSTRSPDTISPG